MRLVLENKDGKAVRTFDVDHDSAFVISRRDTRRVEVHASLAALDAQKVKYDQLGIVNGSAIQATPLVIGHDGAKLKVLNDAGDILRNEKLSEDSSRSWYGSLIIMAILMISLIVFVLNRPAENAKLEQEMKKEIVMIVKNIPKPKREEQPQLKKVEEAEVKQPTPTKKTASIKRMGALSVLGSLNNSKQHGGVNLGAVNTTAGPGLGGTQGSGGVQTTLYGKGLVAAPLGAGSNMQGGGGYGTKGKGGGQAGYGKLSLIGSAGTAPIPLGKEAIIEGGLDRDLIAEVVNRNMGQVRFCYEQGLQGDPSLAGRVAIGWTIGGNGQVKTAGVDSTTLNSKIVEDCIVMRLRSWKFPLPEGGVDVKVSFPFVLRRTGQG
jgi:hypothetical protein